MNEPNKARLNGGRDDSVPVDLTGPPVRTDLRGPVARIVLDKPPVNAFDSELIEELRAAVIRVRESDALAVVFSGAGRTLAAGGDLKWMNETFSSGDRRRVQLASRVIQQLMDDIEHLPIPTIAMITGPTLGGGLELALACDLRVAADDATIGLPEATVGLLAAAGGTQRLHAIVGKGVALELMYSGRMISASEGHALRLINRVAPAGELEETVSALLAEILRSTSAARSAVKACVLEAIENGRGAGLTTESVLIEQLATRDDTLERLHAFAERHSAKGRQ